MIIATVFGFSLKEAAAIGIIGAADGPTTIYVASKFAPKLLGPLSVAAYSYMAMVPIIQPPIVKLLTTPDERRIKMPYKENYRVSRLVKIAFPIVVTLIMGLIAPISVALVGLLMFGNLLREVGVLERLSRTAQNELANIVTLLLGITIGGSMAAERFLVPTTLAVLAMGLAAFVFDTMGGVMVAKLVNMFLKEKVNPMIGACGISAFPMSARVIAKMALKEDVTNHIVMPAIGANVAGQVGSIIAGGLILSLVGGV
jgi:sodium ion-translocating decarboxylase beta subunit